MDEIQRYHWTSAGMQKGCEDKYSAMSGVLFVTAEAYTAALAAQAEEHLCRRKSDDADWGDRFMALSREHAKELAEARGEGEPALMHFQHLRLIGEPCMIHRDYEPTMDRLVDIANECDVKLYITHSMRRLNQKLVGAIVEQAERSNHHAGSALDLNVVYEGVWYTSEMMERREDLPSPVRRFLHGVRADSNLRWGGDFADKDPVHFDDDLVRRDPDEWARRVKELNDV